MPSPTSRLSRSSATDSHGWPATRRGPRRRDAAEAVRPGGPCVEVVEVRAGGRAVVVAAATRSRPQRLVDDRKVYGRVVHDRDLVDPTLDRRHAATGTRSQLPNTRLDAARPRRLSGWPAGRRRRL
jgi:hypothetical protein